MLGSVDYRTAAKQVAGQFAEYDAASRFASFVQECLPTPEG